MDVRSSQIAALRSDLLAADFTVTRLAELWGEDAAAALHRGHRVPARRALDALGGFDPAAVLARFFVLGLPADEDALARALPALGLPGAHALGLVNPGGREPGSDVNSGGRVAPAAGGRVSRPSPAVPSLANPLIDLRPYNFTDSWGTTDWWIASDPGELTLGTALPVDHVLGVGGASLTLSGLQLERPSNLTLDLGTGCGIQAMHASRHSGRVIATDISQRALDFAALNVELNDIRNIEFRLGSLFEPVAGERFDRIVSNPPFVITPRTDGVPEYEYRDGGMVGDSLVREVITTAANHLTPGGIAQLLGNWEYTATEDGLDRVAGWIDAAGLEGWVVEREVQDPALYAQTWIRDGGTRAGEESERLEDAWLDDFADRGVTSVGFGYVLLRNHRWSSSEPEARHRWSSSEPEARVSRPGTPQPKLQRYERLDAPVASALGPHLDATLTAFDWQESLDDNALARAMLTVATDVTEERHYWPGDDHPAVMNLRQGGGFARSYPLGTALAAVVGACDGELSIGAICAAVADLLEVDEADLRSEVLPDIRELVTVGMLRA